MEPINEKDLKNICGGLEIRETSANVIKTLAIVGLALIMCSLFTGTSVLLVKDIKKTNRKLKQYPEVNNTDKFYIVKHIKKAKNGGF